MKIKPHKWTKHHGIRIFHISVFVASLFIFYSVCWGLITVFYDAQADLSSNQDVSLSAQVALVTEGPTTVNSGGGSLFAFIKPKPKADIVVSGPELTLFIHPSVKVEHQKVDVDGKSEFRDVIDEKQPIFYGHSNAKDSPVFLELYSNKLIKATTLPDAEGNWVWQSPVSLPDGPYTIFAAIFNSSQGKFGPIVQLDFFIQHTSENFQLANIEQNPSLIFGKNPSFNQEDSLFDVIVNVPTRYKTVIPGEEVLVNVQLINFGQSGSPVDVPVVYSILDGKGREIIRRSETIAVATTISFVKSFILNPAVEEGVYTLSVSVPSQGAVAISQDTFTVKGNPVIALSPVAKVDFNVVVQALIALFFLSVAILYFEYNKVTVLSRFIKKISEQDLKSEIN